jgi:hypothetical protein
VLIKAYLDEESIENQRKMSETGSEEEGSDQSVC